MLELCSFCSCFWRCFWCLTFIFAAAVVVAVVGSSAPAAAAVFVVVVVVAGKKGRDMERERTKKCISGIRKAEEVGEIDKKHERCQGNVMDGRKIF